MLRAVLIAMIAVHLPCCGVAQHAPEWLNPTVEDQTPSATEVDTFRPDSGCTPADLFREPTEQSVRRFKKQAVQKVTVAGGWVGATQGNDLNSSFLETSIGLGVPLDLIGRKLSGAEDGSVGDEVRPAGREAPDIFGVTPSFRVDFVDAAPGIDVPAELFATGVSFFGRRTVNDRLSAMAIVQPAVRSDFTTSDKAFRIFGLGLLTWDYVPKKVSLSLGAVYLDRADLPLLPAVGVTWTPRTSTRMELRFPQSRLAWRLAKDGGASETWTYLTAGIGGNTWAVTRASGQPDELSLRDIRLTLGMEQIVDGGGGWLAEAGYAFNRRIEYASTDTDISLSDGFVLQAGWRY